MKTRAPLVSVLLVLVLGAGCDLNPRSVVPMEDRRALYPILLVGGYFDPNVWHETGVISYLIGQGLTTGGALDIRELAGPVYPHEREIPVADVYEIAITDPASRQSVWEDEIRAAVLYVRETTGSPGVVLIGFGFGGLAARSYVVRWKDDHGVARLVTVATPHAGLELADRGATSQEWAKEPSLPHIIGTWFTDLAGSAIGVDFSAPVMLDMRSVSQNVALQRLNEMPYPAEIAYVNIIVEHAGDNVGPTGYNFGSVWNVNTLPSIDSQSLQNVSGLKRAGRPMETELFVRLTGASYRQDLPRAVYKAIGGDIQFLHEY